MPLRHKMQPTHGIRFTVISRFVTLLMILFVTYPVSLQDLQVRTRAFAPAPLRLGEGLLDGFIGRLEDVGLDWIDFALDARD